MQYPPIEIGLVHDFGLFAVMRMRVASALWHLSTRVRCATASDEYVDQSSISMLDIMPINLCTTYNVSRV